MKNHYLLKFVFTAATLLACTAPVRAEEQTIDPKVDEAIESGLQYLASTQHENGSFPGKYGSGGAISALSGMAFLAKGYLPGNDEFGMVLNRCIDYVLSCTDKKGEGFLGEKQEGNGKMYAHSICTLFLSEVSGQVDRERQERIDAVLPGAVKILLDAQSIKKSDRDKGGWRYQRTSRDSDMSCSGWALMALRSCRLNGGRVPPKAIQNAVEYVKRHSSSQGSFVYQKGGSDHKLTLTGAGILCLELCGRHNDPLSLKAAQFLLRSHRELERQSNKYYGMYYTAQGLFQVGGEPWRVFSNWMYRTWMPKQNANGSFPGGEGSTAYGTSLMLLAFTVPYRQLPIYQRDETVDED